MTCSCRVSTAASPYSHGRAHAPGAADRLSGTPPKPRVPSADGLTAHRLSEPKGMVMTERAAAVSDTVDDTVAEPSWKRRLAVDDEIPTTRPATIGALVVLVLSLLWL